jgi:hypothetical protein
MTDQNNLVHFAPAIVLTKDEVFEACAGLARVGSLLLMDGHLAEASWAAILFEDLEDRLAGQWPDDQVVSSVFSGSKSSERELTQ